MAKTFYSISFLAMLLIFSGCPGRFMPLQDGLADLEGQHLKKAVNVLGVPNNMIDWDGKKIYFWQNQTKQLLIKGTFQGDTYLENTEYICHVKIETNQQRIITKAVHEGNYDACKKWINAFKGQQ